MRIAIATQFVAQPLSDLPRTSDDAVHSCLLVTPTDGARGFESEGYPQIVFWPVWDGPAAPH